MKALKLAAFALTLGFFAASCGNSAETTTPPVDSPAVEAPAEAPATEPAAAPAVDSPAAPAATTDTAAKAK